MALPCCTNVVAPADDLNPSREQVAIPKMVPFWTPFFLVEFCAAAYFTSTSS
jgi:hypothetical protein